MVFKISLRKAFYRSADANRALNQYAAAFGDVRGFYLRGGRGRSREEEAEYARQIRQAVASGRPLTDAEIREMYGIVYEDDYRY